MTEEHPSKTSAATAVPERRARPRPTRAAGDWESVALLRVASRVQSLTAIEPAAAADATNPGFGWEDAVLRNLSERLKDRGSR